MFVREWADDSVIQEFGVVEIRTFDVRGGPLGDRDALLDARSGDIAVRAG